MQDNILLKILSSLKFLWSQMLQQFRPVSYIRKVMCCFFSLLEQFCHVHFELSQSGEAPRFVVASFPLAAVRHVAFMLLSSVIGITAFGQGL
jgi:hypothetical protein